MASFPPQCLPLQGDGRPVMGDARLTSAIKRDRSPRSLRRRKTLPRSPSHLDELEAQCLDTAKKAVQRGLIGNRAMKDGFDRFCRRTQVELLEFSSKRTAQAASDPYFATEGHVRRRVYRAPNIIPTLNDAARSFVTPPG